MISFSRLAASTVCCLLLFVLVDIALWRWHPRPSRLPDSFSGTYLRARIDAEASAHDSIVMVGDSTLWGYGGPSQSTAPALIARNHPSWNIVNLSYEGGSPANYAVLMRLIKREGLHPRLVVLCLNVKEFNPVDSSYRRLHPGLLSATRSNLTDEDRQALDLGPPETAAQRLDRAVSTLWRFYGMRTDLREAVFQQADMATALQGWLSHLTGLDGRQAAAHRPTADRFLGTYDLAPISEKNVSYIYLRQTLDELRKDAIRAVVYETPTNHALLSEYIDDPQYDANLKSIGKAVQSFGYAFYNYDRKMPEVDFIDNDHLTASGNRRLARALDADIQANLP